MRENKIIINPFGLVDLLVYREKNEFGEHGHIYLEGNIKSNKKDLYFQKAAQTDWVEICAIDENKTKVTLFVGIIIKFDITSEKGLYKLCLELKTGTYLMDLNPHIRTFQSESLLYKDLLKVCTSNYYSGKYIMNKGKNEKIKQFFLQYKETDWMFCKRVASRLYTTIFPDCTKSGCCFSFGLPERNHIKSIAYENVKYIKNLGELIQKQKNGIQSLKENDILTIVVKSREIHYLGNYIKFNDNDYIVSKLERKLEHSEIYNYYYLRRKNGVKDIPLFNYDMIGASLNGIISNVKSDVVQLCIQQDENSKNTGTRWFPYSTVYSSPDGSGWYCMPEIGDSVRLYIPIEDEKDAYVISSTHLSGQDQSKRSDPSIKSLMNKEGKEVRLTPNSILITNNKGMSIELIDDDGIKIISDKKITIKSDQEIEMVSTNERVLICGNEQVQFLQENTELKLQDNIFVEGDEVRIQ